MTYLQLRYVLFHHPGSTVCMHEVECRKCAQGTRATDYSSEATSY